MLVKENQISQAKECSAVLYLGGCASLGSLGGHLGSLDQAPCAHGLRPSGLTGERLHVGLDGGGSSPLGPLRARQLLLEG